MHSYKVPRGFRGKSGPHHHCFFTILNSLLDEVFHVFKIIQEI